MTKTFYFTVKAEVDWPLNNPPNASEVAGTIQDAIDQAREGVDDGIQSIQVFVQEQDT